LEQSGVGAEHAILHPPHVIASVRLVSQPSSGREEQCAKPMAHAEGGTKQAPARHSTAATSATLGSVVQSWPHSPQFLGSAADPQTAGSPEASAAMPSFRGRASPWSEPASAAPSD